MYYKSNKISFYYEKYGNKKDKIIILPGWGDTRKTFQFLIENLKNNFSIYIMDYPSFGNSKIPINELTIYDYANAIRDFIKKEKIKKPNIIAHSFGGRITSILIGKYKIQANRIILIDVAGIKRKKLKAYLKEKIYKILKKCITFLPSKQREKYRKKLFSFFASSDYKDIPNVMKKTFQNIVKENLIKYYKKIENETLIIWGDKDIDTPLKDGILLKKIIKNSELITYKKAQHFSYLNYPILTLKIIQNFFK
ncbi:MAG: alpha/beta hydrolase [Bacilli bacterium]|nr:alpha/beta hydrolase [Bacilli bacterium]